MQLPIELRDKSQAGGVPTVHSWFGLTARRVVGAIAIYPDREDFFREYPELREDDVKQALEFAAANLEDFVGMGVARYS